MRRLNLGCGNRKRNVDEGWINVDMDKECNPDVVRDFENEGLPFDTDSVDEVYASHIVEHVNNIYFFMYEIWRVCKNGAKVEVIAPYGFTEWAIQPDHVRFMNRKFFSQWFPNWTAVENARIRTRGAMFRSLKTELFNPGSDGKEREIRYILMVIKDV